jgi:RNA-directed DNA polymerase
MWHRAHGRRSQKGQVKRERMQQLIERYIPRARIVHPWPSVTFAVMTRGKRPEP